MNTERRTEPSLNNRLCRNPRRGKLFGVCAGLSEYFGFDLTATRVLMVIGAFFFFPIVVIAYVVLGVLLPRKPDDVNEPYDPVQTKVRSDPHDMLSGVRYRFRDLDSRLQRLEKYVTSNRFNLDREFRHLKE
jgi:phage shock protein C